MNDINAHVKKLFEDIPDSARKGELQQEITQNLNDKVSDLVASGLTVESAVNKAVNDFGDVGDLREELADSARTAKVKSIGLTLAFSIWGAALVTALALFINFYYTPDNIWFVYPLFAVVWWPVSLYFHWVRTKTLRPVGFAYSVCGFLLFTGFMIFINMYYTPHIIWFIYPVFAVVWWPLAMLFFGSRRKIAGEDE